MGSNYETQSQAQDSLILYSKHNPVIRQRTIVSGTAALLRGAVLGEVTASGKLQDYDTGETNGAEVAGAILLEDTDASAGDVEANVLEHGAVNEADLNGNGANAAARLVTRQDLAPAGVYVYTDYEA